MLLASGSWSEEHVRPMESASQPDLTAETASARRLIAIVHADIAGYSRHIGRDDAGTRDRLRTIRRELIDPELNKHIGRLVNTAGDALLIEFASITAAVQCFAEVQRRMPEFDGDLPPGERIRFRVGINIGDVLPEGTDIHGDGINVAARLQAVCPVGGMCVSRAVRDHVGQQLNLTFEALGPLTLKNIARPIEAFVLRLDPGAAAAEPVEFGRDGSPPAAGARRWSKRRLVSIAAVLLVILGVGWWLANSAVSPLIQPAKASLPDLSVAHAPALSVAVLPFRNISDNPEQEYLADGIAEDLATELSHIRGFLVTAHRSAFSYKGKNTVDARQAGSELGVRYLLEGSVRKIGEVLRVNAQLASCETGSEVWADRFDLPLGALAEGQDDIIRRIAVALNVKMVDVESARSTRERPGNSDAFDLVLRARSLTNQPPSRERTGEIRALYEQALQLDPSSVPAMLGVAAVLINQSQGYLGQWAAGDELERAGKLVSTAQAIEPTSEGVLVALVSLLDAQHRWPDVIPVAERLIQAFPNRVDGYQYLALAKGFIGKWDEEAPLHEKSIRLNPRDPNLFHHYSFLAVALLHSGRYEEAAIWMERSLAANPEAPRPIRGIRYQVLAGLYAKTGRPDDAHRALAEGQKLWPFFTVRTQFPRYPASAALVAHMRKWQEISRLGGMRDHADEDADFGVAADDKLHQDLAGYTPTTVPGAATIKTAALGPFLAERKPIVIDTANYSWGVSLPGAIGLEDAGLGGSFSDGFEDRLRRKLQALTEDDLAVPIVAVGWNSERFDGRNLTLRLVALGYTHVYWYRGGREAWEVSGLPETPLTMQDW
jgi:TolB-like protein/class 3 adenylate cyclase/tetratricopeptide (TPR) repeat protein